MVLIPLEAVQTVGQLETVKVLEDRVVKIRHVKTGRKLSNGKVEIISGSQSRRRGGGEVGTWRINPGEPAFYTKSGLPVAFSARYLPCVMAIFSNIMTIPVAIL